MGSGIFLAFVIIFVIVTAFALYTRKGSGINSRPGKHGGSAPGAEGPGTMKGDEGERTVGTHGTG
jgi:hypothetical protein